MEPCAWQLADDILLSLNVLSRSHEAPGGLNAFLIIGSILVSDLSMTRVHPKTEPSENRQWR